MNYKHLDSEEIYYIEVELAMGKEHSKNKPKSVELTNKKTITLPFNLLPSKNGEFSAPEHY